MGTLSSGTRKPTERANSLTADPEEARAARRASAAGRRPVTGGRTLGAVMRKTPIVRFCWQPTMVFPPMLETTVEETTSFFFHPRGRDFGEAVGTAGVYFACGAASGTDGKYSNVFQVWANSPNLSGLEFTAPSPEKTTSTYDAQTVVGGTQHGQNRKTPFVKEFLRHYKHGIVTHSRSAVSFENPDKIAEAQDVVCVMKKHTLASEHDTRSADYNQWELLNQSNGINGNSARYGNFDFTDYRHRNAVSKGSFLSRAPLFENNLLMAKHTMSGENASHKHEKTVLHDHWSLQADEGVDIATIMESHLQRNDETAITSSGGADAITSVWAFATDGAASPSFTVPAARPSWYVTVIPPSYEETWNNVSHVPGVNDGTPTRAGTPASEGPTFFVTIKRQLDIVFFDYTPADLTRQEGNLPA